MEAILRPAEEVPAIFTDRLNSRSQDEVAQVVTMTAEFCNNQVIDALLEHGRPDDAFAIDHLGDLHGSRARLFRGNHEGQETFQEGFPGSYAILNPSSVGRLGATLLERSHIKAYRVGSRILSAGGVNCVPVSFHNFVDLMLDFESEEYADFLDRFIAHKGNLRDEGIGESIRLNATSELLVDYGRKGRSSILDNLLTDLDRDPEETIVTSSYAPYGQLDEQLYRLLRRGKQVEFYANSPSKFHGPHHSSTERWLQQYSAWRAKTPWADRLTDRFTHLKAALLRHQNGTQIAYVGSATFHELPILAGTAEVCLRTTDDKLVGQLEAYINCNLVNPGPTA